MTTEPVPFDVDDDTLLDVMFECLCDNSWGVAAGLPPIGSCARVVGDVLQADFCICEAGFQALIRYDTVFDLTSIVESFVSIGATHAADCVRAAFDTFPPAVIAGPPALRWEIIPEPDAFDPIGYAGQLSIAYCEQSGIVRGRLVEYIRTHQAELSTLFEDRAP